MVSAASKSADEDITFACGSQLTFRNPYKCEFGDNPEEKRGKWYAIIVRSATDAETMTEW